MLLPSGGPRRWRDEKAGPGAPGDVGWTAYTPLEPRAGHRSDLGLSFDDSWTVLWTGRHLVGVLLIVVGLLVLSAAAGRAFGRRSSARS